MVVIVLKCCLKFINAFSSHTITNKLRACIFYWWTEFQISKLLKDTKFDISLWMALPSPITTPKGILALGLSAKDTKICWELLPGPITWKVTFICITYTLVPSYWHWIAIPVWHSKLMCSRTSLGYLVSLQDSEILFSNLLRSLVEVLPQAVQCVLGCSILNSGPL